MRDTRDFVPLFMLLLALTILRLEIDLHPKGSRHQRSSARWFGLALVWSLALACAIWVWSVG